MSDARTRNCDERRAGWGAALRLALDPIEAQVRFRGEPGRIHRASRTRCGFNHVRGCRRRKSSAISRMVRKRTPGFELMCSNRRSCMASTCGRPDTSG